MFIQNNEQETKNNNKGRKKGVKNKQSNTLHPLSPTKKQQQKKPMELPGTKKVLCLHTSCWLQDQVLQKYHNRVEENFQKINK